MQRHIPLGYSVAQGKAQIDPETSQVVQDIYTAYDNGASCNAIAKDLTAKGIQTANQKAVWHCCMVGKILENQKYLGDGFYPQMIEEALFQRVQERRKERAKKLGKTNTLNGYNNRTLWNELLICGQCGSVYWQCVDKQQQKQWKCKKDVHKKGMGCENLSLTQVQLEDGFLRVLKEVMEHPSCLIQRKSIRERKQSLLEIRLTKEIQNLLMSPCCDAKRLKELAYERAMEQYQHTVVDDSDFQTEKLLYLLSSTPVPTKFDSHLLAETMRKVVVAKEGYLEFHFKNGYQRKTWLKEE